ncbi:MAG: MFS transporter, partial [Rhodoferax sp.]|nr:MFS transporter [Rhodoferax sp.]
DNKRLMMLAFGGIVLCLGALFMPQEAIVALLIIVFLLICISAVNNGMVAFALGMVPKSISGLSVGLFFGGLSGAIAIFGYLVPKPAELVLLHVLGLAALACICASGTIASGKYLRKLQS